MIYELHVGTFSPEGTFRGVENRLDALVDLGVTAIELMPVADFPGTRDWGYDGALLFAPDSQYGRPEDLKALIDAAHARGLMVLLDVVYNHFGPEGNYLYVYAKRFFDAERHTPWGAAINFDGKDSRAVREFFIENAALLARRIPVRRPASRCGPRHRRPFAAAHPGGDRRAGVRDDPRGPPRAPDPGERR